ncbi:aryl-sulfate sulfotransferase, partial [Candidatus Bipolaricaulota bacterium]|nr:aryl-sulfate sulfotransferase [Candidatus Bipolaricaulota bacterium]
HAHLHHDVSYMPNGNVLMIAWESKTRREALAVGLSVHQLPNSSEVWSEMILEYNPVLDEIVWTWHLWDHALPIGEDPTANPGKIDLEFASNRQSPDWWHFNSVDYSEELDQIVISVRNISEIWIIDHALTSEEASGSAGDLLYRWGNPAAYGGSGSQELVHQHDAEFLSNGNLLVFDNGDPKLRPYSRVLELNLPDYQSGATSQARVLPAQIAWQYPNEQDVSRDILFADHISGAQRLESGNTLICSGTEGRFLEVTPLGNIVWEYVNPFTSIGKNGKPSNEVFRCEQYESDYPGLLDRD